MFIYEGIECVHRFCLWTARKDRSASDTAVRATFTRRSKRGRSCDWHGTLLSLQQRDPEAFVANYEAPGIYFPDLVAMLTHFLVRSAQRTLARMCRLREDSHIAPALATLQGLCRCISLSFSHKLMLILSHSLVHWNTLLASTFRIETLLAWVSGGISYGHREDQLAVGKCSSSMGTSTLPARKIPPSQKMTRLDSDDEKGPTCNLIQKLNWLFSMWSWKLTSKMTCHSSLL